MGVTFAIVASMNVMVTCGGVRIRYDGLYSDSLLDRRNSKDVMGGERTRLVNW